MVVLWTSCTHARHRIGYLCPVLDTIAGTTLALTTRALAAARPASKPLHPRGRVVVGTLRRRGLTSPTGVGWLDAAGRDDVLVRLSRAVGLPGPLPDIHGLALRLPVDGGGHGDLLLASTGWSPAGRFVLTASRRLADRPLTTLLPYRTPVGPLLLGARAEGEERFELSLAVGAGAWSPFATLELTTTDADPLVSFDPVRNQVPGLEQYPWVVRLREPSYAVARRSRRG